MQRQHKRHDQSSQEFGTSDFSGSDSSVLSGSFLQSIGPRPSEISAGAPPSSLSFGQNGGPEPSGTATMPLGLSALDESTSSVAVQTEVKVPSVAVVICCFEPIEYTID